MGKEIFDSSSDWVADHIKRYVATNGEDGHEWNGTQILLITTTGRQSGKLRRSALIYGRDGDDYVIVGSRGGHSHHPSWYLNLDADPNVTLQVKGDVFSAVASTIEDKSDYQRLWDVMLTHWPAYAEYQEKTSRRIPLVRLRRA
ncbi:MAG: nitroreductase family deazaflavin-dependent oxidoreductase [Ilumatobacteraceae bacterium]